MTTPNLSGLQPEDHVMLAFESLVNYLAANVAGFTLVGFTTQYQADLNNASGLLSRHQNRKKAATGGV